MEVRVYCSRELISLWRGKDGLFRLSISIVITNITINLSLKFFIGLNCFFRVSRGELVISMACCLPLPLA